MSDSRRLKLNDKKDDDMKTLMIIDGHNARAYSEDFTAWNSWNNNKSIEANVAVYDCYDIYIGYNGVMFKPTSFMKDGNNLKIYYNNGNSATTIVALMPLTSYSGFENGDPRSNY